MSWRDIFKSSHTLWLEREYAALIARHQQELAELRNSLQSQLNSAIVHGERLQEELQRTRVLLSPGLQGISLPHEEDHETPPPVGETFTGTPWMRTQAREMAKEKARGRQIEAARSKGANHGDAGQHRADAPQRVESQAS